MTKAGEITGSSSELNSECVIPPTVTVPPIVTFFYCYRTIAREISALFHSCEWTASGLAPLDELARHDVVLSPTELETRGLKVLHTRQTPLRHLSEGLQRALNGLNETSGRIDGYFHGELKVKTEDRLNRLKANAQAMLEAIQQAALEQEPPRSPYAIRQQGLSSLHRDFVSLATLMGNLRRNFCAEPAIEHLMPAVYEQESRLCRLKAKVGRWRDNPSQKMRANLASCTTEMKQLEEEAIALVRETLLQCAKEKILIFNRQGPVDISQI